MKQKKTQEETKPRTVDVLEAYPEREQVSSFPERRYIKMIRFFTILSIINLSLLIGISGLYYYMAQNIDISIENNGKVLFYDINPEKQVMAPSEKNFATVSALNVLLEETILKYLKARYTVIYDRDKMNQRWEKLPKDAESDEFNVLSFTEENIQRKFSDTSKSISDSLLQQRIVRDTHIYSLYQERGDLWSAFIETFDFKLDDNLNRPCNCQDNSPKCISCKKENTISRKRYKIWLRANFFSTKGKTEKELQKNPLNILIYAYYPISLQIPDEKDPSFEKFWGIPADLRSDL